MKITINSNVLSKYGLSLEQFVILLSSYCNIDYQKVQKELEQKGLIERNLFSDFPPIISNNTKDLVARVIVESDDRINNCSIKDFEALANQLRKIYPDGIKPGKTYPWKGDVEEIAQKLRTLVVKYDFDFTEAEAIAATKEYVSSFQHPYTYMHTLRNFLLFARKENGNYTIESQFMSIIENNRDESNN